MHWSRSARDIKPARDSQITFVTLLLAIAWAEHLRTPSTPAAAVSVAYAAADGRDGGAGAASLALSADSLTDARPEQILLRGSDVMAVNVTSGTVGTTVEASPMTAWYRLAEAEYGVSHHLLRALHQVESNAAPDGCVANLEGSGAIGPFQFKPATFKQFGVDANYDSHRDICSFVDALFAAAHYLRELGAGDLDSSTTRRALTRYGTDLDRVLTLAIHYQETAAHSR